MQPDDIDAVHELLERYLQRFEIAPVYSKEEIKHWLLNMETDEKGLSGTQIETGLAL